MKAPIGPVISSQIPVFLFWRKPGVCWLAVGLLFVAACTAPPASDSLSDEELARIHCGSCHLFPTPDLLPQDKWAVVLPRMGARLGIASPRFDPFADQSMETRQQLEEAGIYPPSPVLTEQEWKRIQDYFLTRAPDKLSLPAMDDWAFSHLFEPRFPELPLSHPAEITLVEFDSESGACYLADRSGSFAKLGPDLRLDYQLSFPMPIVDIERSADRFLRLLSIGQLYPNEGNSGALLQVRDESPMRPQLLVPQLSRPVQFTFTDIDRDEDPDAIICSFGNLMGRLSWLEYHGRTFTETVLKPVPGATRVLAEDLDGNGYQDLMVLFAQGDEGISIFYNEAGEFREDKVLRFHPVFGSNDFEFVDMDADGHKDIVLSNGDNGDYSNVLKPYHGLRIFRNNGQQQFSESFFFPCYGASKLRCRDFDRDGDLDLFLMAFYPDFDQNGKQSLVYLENQGEWTFQPYAIPGASAGRWMVMDVGDLDQDGDEDVVLGSFVLQSLNLGANLMETWKESPHTVMVLENQQMP